MRVDQVQSLKIESNRVQAMVNRLVSEGKSSTYIQEWLNKLGTQYFDHESDSYVDIAIKHQITPSNIGGGLIVYMKCPKCYKNRRYLYLINGLPLCRQCLGLTYKKMTHRECEIRRLVKNPDLLAYYLNSHNYRNISIAIEASEIIAKKEQAEYYCSYEDDKSSWD